MIIATHSIDIYDVGDHEDGSPQMSVKLSHFEGEADKVVDLDADGLERLAIMLRGLASHCESEAYKLRPMGEEVEA